MSVLSRTAKLAIAAEPDPGTYQPPAFTVVYSSQRRPRYHQRITRLDDSAYRGSDSWQQDMLQGPAWSEWVIPSDLYPDLAGWYLRALVGPDTCTPGVSTVLAAPAAQGTSSVSLPAEPPAGFYTGAYGTQYPGPVLMLGAGDTLEYAQAGVPSGTGPYVVPLDTPLRFAHAAAEPVVSQAAHVFAQAGAGGIFTWPAYSLTMDDGTGPLGWPACVFSSLTIGLGEDGTGSLKAACSGWPPASQETFGYAASAMQPMQGWEWAITTGGGASTRGLAMDLTLSRELQVQPCVNGQQAPAAIWPGPLRADGTYSAIFEDQSDLDLYWQASQEPCVHTVTQPVLAGGCSLTLTMPRSGWHDGEPDQAGAYLSAQFRLAGIADPAGGGAFTATLLNYVQGAYT